MLIRPSEAQPKGKASVNVRFRAAGLVSLLVVVIGLPVAGAVTFVFAMIALEDLSGAPHNFLPMFILVGWCAAVAGAAVVTTLVKPYVSRVSANRLDSTPMVGCSAIGGIAVVGASARFFAVGQEYWWLSLFLLAPFLGALAGSFVRANWHSMIVGTIVAAVVVLVVIAAGL